MAEIVPAILSKDFSEIRERLRLLDGVAEWIQLDVADGQFVAAESWRRPGDLAGVGGQFKIEIHLMVDRPERVIEEWLPVADRVLIHVEAGENIAEVLVEAAGGLTEIGASVLCQTPLDVLDPLAGRLKTLQLMGISEVGYQGQRFNPSVVERVKILRRRFPHLQLAVDGGVNEGNMNELIVAGAGRLVIGSAIWEAEDPLAALRRLQALAG